MGSAIIYATHNAHLLNTDQAQPITFTASVNPVHTIISSSTASSQPFSFLTVAESDHYITVFRSATSRSAGMLRTENAVLSMTLSGQDEMASKGHEIAGRPETLPPQQVLLAMNKDGAVEMFPSPFTIGSSSAQKEAETDKSRMKQRTRKASALVRMVRPDKGRTPVPLLNASFQGDEVVMAWTEGGVNLFFDRFRFRDGPNGNLTIDGVKEIVKPQMGSNIGAVVMNGVKDVGKKHVDESRSVVINGGGEDDDALATQDHEVINISSGDEDDESEPDMMDEEEGSAVADHEDVEMQEGDDVIQDDMEGVRDPPPETAASADVGTALIEAPDAPDEPEEPTFGDLIRANAPEPIPVPATLAAPHEQSLAPTGAGSISLPSGVSLGTVLAQSLRTNDVNLLESCLHVKDYPTVRATIERLESSLATNLLHKLAERLNSRPGRAGSLMVWIQWTLIAHGGYLVNQPEVLKKLSSLHRVVKERAKGLQPLLMLKGKLDMLEAQMNLRKSMQARSRATKAADDDDDDDEGVIYVEGQDQSDHESASEDEDVLQPPGARRRSQPASHEVGSASEEDDESDAKDETRAMTNGIAPPALPDDSDSDDDGFIDDEASSTDQDSDDEASSDAIDHESVDDSDSDASSIREIPAPKRPANANGA